MFNRLILGALILWLILGSCKGDDGFSFQYPESSVVEDLPELTNIEGVSVSDGGYGSSMAADPKSNNHLYLLTDRGPNFDTGVSGEKGFAVADFAPRIGRFKIVGDELLLDRTIKLKDQNGKDISGLPNPLGQGGTGEIPKDIDGNILDFDIQGLDSEGLVALTDGTFWISDEYGPHIVHFDAKGKTIERINPFSGARALPQVFQNRRPNRGMEGLTITPNKKVLVGIMQSTMDNPDTNVRGEGKLTRILFFDIKSGKSKEYAYIQEAAANSNSEILALSNTEFLVIERDSHFFPEAKYKRIYKININGATDISDPSNSLNGMVYNGKTLEQMTEDELKLAGIQPVSKELVVDMLQYNAYPHDKMEGIVVINSRLIAVVNDDDFSITAGDSPNTIQQKVIPENGNVDRSTVYFVRLEKPVF